MPQVHSFLIFFIAFSLTVSIDANNQQVKCVQAVGVWGKTCRVCLRAKQKCDALWGKVAAENSQFSVF